MLHHPVYICCIQVVYASALENSRVRTTGSLAHPVNVVNVDEHITPRLGNGVLGYWPKLSLRSVYSCADARADNSWCPQRASVPNPPHHYLGTLACVNEADAPARVMLLPRHFIPIYIFPMSARILRPTGVIVQASTRAMTANAM